MLNAMAEVHESDPDDGLVWKLRSVRGSVGHAHLAFGACSHPASSDVQGAFKLWVQLRHHDVLAVRKDVDGLTTVAVLLTPRQDGMRPWDTTVVAVSGDVKFSTDQLEMLRGLWPTPAAVN